MKKATPMTLFLRERGRKMLWAALGLFLFAFGIYTQLAAGVGVSPWNVLSDGLAKLTGLSFGNASIIISFLVVLLDVWMKEPIGIATLMDAILIGWWTDMFIWMDFLPQPSTTPGKLVLLVFGVFVICYGQYLYMRAGLSCGPRDALLVAVGKRFPRIPIGIMNIILMALALAAGWLMGGITGFGTILTMFCMGFCMDLVFFLVHFEPRLVHQEGLSETWAAFRAARIQTKEN